MRIGAALVLIAIGAILRFAITTVSTHGIAVHTVGDILMVVGAIGVVLWLAIWAPWARNRRSAYPTRPPVGEERRAAYPPDGRYGPDERYYEDQFPR